MTMPQAIRSAFVRWCTFSGRAGGTEYWWFVLFGTIVFGLASLLDQAAFGRQALFWATCTLVFLPPYVAVAVPRLQDTNRSGWWLLLALCPAGQHRSVDLVLCAQHGGAQPVRPDAGCDLG
jgi:uncharacterized membrane protein YhaH (DUF805 family)